MDTFRDFVWVGILWSICVQNISRCKIGETAIEDQRSGIGVKQVAIGRKCSRVIQSTTGILETTNRFCS